MKDFSLAGCVILYNPDDDVVRNIESYVDYIDELYVVDNSNGEHIVNELLQKYSNITVLKYNTNMGIAYSLNEVLRRCNTHHTHLMTMDQDSCFTIGSMEKYVNEVKHFDWDKILGIAPKIVDATATSHCSNVVWEKTIIVITSGNIISVKNAITIGGFDENLFIDEVDHEFCYRGFVRNLLCYTCCSGIYLKHKIGVPLRKFLIFRYFTAMNHNYIRKYYIFRNRLYVYKRYHHINEKFFFRRYIKHLFYIFLGILFMENDKIRKLKYTVKGIGDFYCNSMGRLIE